MNKTAQRKHSHGQQAFAERLITHLSPRSAVSEAYRTLRTNIQFGALDRAVKTIMATSAGPGEGKSTTIANLAIAFAQAGHRCLLIDADLRRPVLHKVFGVDQRRGLSAVLVGKVEVAAAIHSVTAVPGLQVLPSGPLPPNPAEMLGSKQWQGLLHGLRESFDFVLIDAPPVIAVADASVLAPQ
ncbi:MAG TPA: capsular biosynthesis protein, partial [Firmicutes bacterium]|nr:capsular biosynthesis protein [Bacillota bacterium]